MLGLSINVLAKDPGAVLYVKMTLFFGLDAHSINNSREKPLFKSEVLASTTCMEVNEPLKNLNYEYIQYSISGTIRQKNFNHLSIL